MIGLYPTYPPSFLLGDISDETLRAFRGKPSNKVIAARFPFIKLTSARKMYWPCALRTYLNVCPRCAGRNSDFPAFYKYVIFLVSFPRRSDEEVDRQIRAISASSQADCSVWNVFNCSPVKGYGVVTAE